MTVVLVAADGALGAGVAAELVGEGLRVSAVVPAADPARAPHEARLAEVDALVLEVRRTTCSSELMAACAAHGTRIVALCRSDDERRVAAERGVAAVVPSDAPGFVIAEAVRMPASSPLRRAAPAASAPRNGVIAVWGPPGSPGRSTIAVELAAELARGAGRVGLVDADSHAPSLALMLGVADEGPGFAAACRQAEAGRLDADELTRISIPVRTAGGRIETLVGINRPGRWPELSAARVGRALEVCRTWADHVVVDVAGSLETDEEIVSDLDGPRRNAATLAAVEAADTVVAVLSADPVGVARFLRSYAELRALVGGKRVVVVANRLRPGTLGLDARGQVRRALERFAAVDDAWFVPLDPRSADAAILAARPIADIAPRSPVVAAVRRFVGEAFAAPPAHRAAAQTSRRTRTTARRLPRTV